MGTYGETLRKIRVQKGYTMKQVANGIVSVSFLSKFERGESEIAIDSFLQLLMKLSVTFDEFQYIHHNYEPEPLTHFFDAIYDAYRRENLTKLKQLKMQELDKWETYQLTPYRCNVLAIEVFENIVQNKAIDNVDKDALSMLYDYLFRVEVWGFYELMLYNYTTLLMPTEMVVTLSKIAYEKSGRYHKMKQIREVIFSIIVNTIIHLLGPVNMHHSKVLGYTQECTYFLSCLDSLCTDEK